MFNQQVFGNRIRERRKAQGLTQEQVGEALGVSAQAVSKWENGESLPDVTLLPALCHVLGESADVLLGIEGIGIESLAEELGRQIHRRQGKEREEVLMKVLPLLHREGPADPKAPGNVAGFYWHEERLHTLRLWSHQGFACTVMSGILESGVVSEEVRGQLRLLLEPGCWEAAQRLLSGPITAPEFSALAQGEGPGVTQGAIERMIDAGLVVRDRRGYRLEARGVVLAGVLKALACVAELNEVGELWYRADDKAKK